MGSNKIKGTQIKDESIESVDIASGSIKAAEADEQLISGQPTATAGSVDTTNDRLLIWDADGSPTGSLKQVSPANLGISGGGGSATPAGSDTQIQFNDGGSSFGASSNLTWDDTELKISGTGTSALLNLHTTEDSSTASPVLELTRVSSTASDADYLGQIKWVGKNNQNGVVTYAKLTGKIEDAGVGSEDGIFEFANIKAGSQTITARLRSDSLQLLNNTNLSVDGSTTLYGSVVVNESGTSTGNFRVESDVDRFFIFADASENKIGIGTAFPTSKLHIHSDTAGEGAVLISQSENSTDEPRLDLSKSRGTGVSPSAVLNGDFIGQIRFIGFDGASYGNFADIFTKAVSNIDGSDHGSSLTIRTSKFGETSPSNALEIDGNQKATFSGAVCGKFQHMTHHRYNDGSGTGKEYIPWVGTSEQASPSYITQGVAPYNGRLVTVLVRSSKSGGLGNTVVGMHIGTDGNTVVNSTAEEEIMISMSAANVTGTFNFSNSNHFAAGDIIGVSIDPTNAHGNVNVTCVWEYNIS